MGVTAKTLAERYPAVYHMAAAGSWPSIQRHGLLSTESLLKLFQVGDDLRRQLVECHRPVSVEIRHPSHGLAVIRDQKPMSDGGLQRALPNGTIPRDWYGLLNSKVFFWLTERRLETMMKARAYRELSKTVLCVDTAALLERYEGQTALAPMNTGCTKPVAHPRSLDTFQPLHAYPFQERLALGREAVVELAVDDGIPDIERVTTRVEEVDSQGTRRIVWER